MPPQGEAFSRASLSACITEGPFGYERLFMPLQVLQDPTASDLKVAGHREALQRELDAVRRLSGALNVAAFQGAYEDAANVYIITELCRGGELWHRIGDKHYSERTVCLLLLRQASRTCYAQRMHACARLGPM